MCKITAPINTYYRIKHPMKINDVKFFQKNGNMFIQTSAYGSKNEEARKHAIDKIREVCLSWAFKMRESLKFDEFLAQVDYYEMGKKGITSSVNAVALRIIDKLEKSKIASIENFSQFLRKSDEYGLKALVYFERALMIKSLKEEAFLNLFKVSELIFERIFGDATEEEIKQIFSKEKKDVVTKEKIEFMCQKLGIKPKLKKGLGNLVDIRNRRDIGHAQIVENKVTDDDLRDCRKLASDVISSYLKLNINLT